MDTYKSVVKSDQMTGGTQHKLPMGEDENLRRCQKYPTL